MDEQKKSSLKVNVSEVSSAIVGDTRVKENGRGIQPREVYKPLPEDWNLQKTEKVEALNFELKSDKEDDNRNMVHEEQDVHDGADEHMLNLEAQNLNEKREEVKFIKGDHQNGDAKIDIGVVNGKVFTGMTKEELMKYANDPFWVRLRWIFFIGFWAIWVGMLVGAILIIIDAPKCAAPEPLPWYKHGPFAKFVGDEVGADDLSVAQKLQAHGVIYELPPEATYAVQEPLIEQKIKDLVNKYKESGINVVLDITPNYVNKESKMWQAALNDATKRSAFFWEERPEKPTNWLTREGLSAWDPVSSGNFVLSQFGKNLYDLHMNDTLVKEELSNALRHLLTLGVKGFRFKNSKYYLVHKTIQDDVPSQDRPGAQLNEYDFWTHVHTTFQEGLGDLLDFYRHVVKNATNDAFLSVADDMVRPEAYLTEHGHFGVDIPIYGPVTTLLRNTTNAARLSNKLQEAMLITKDHEHGWDHPWLQWEFVDAPLNNSVPADAYALYLSLVPGTLVVPASSAFYGSIAEDTLRHIKNMRESNSFMFGDFHTHSVGELAAYSRIKSGNPGYLVVFNPTNRTQAADFSVSDQLPSKLTVEIVSANNGEIGNKQKNVKDVEVGAYACIVYTYVPVQA